MFQGSYCHPISPTQGLKAKSSDGEVQLGIDENDQIFKITSKIDINKTHDLSNLTDEQQVEYMENIVNLTDKEAPIREKFSKTSPELQEILE